MPTFQLKSAAYPLPLADVKTLMFNTILFRDRCIIKTLFWTGLRRHELTKLDIRDIDFDRKRLRVHGKGDKVRTVPIIDDEFLSDLRHQIGRRTKGHVFLSPNGNSLSLQAINNITKRAGQRAKISNPNPKLHHINPHIFRHSIARYLKTKGFSAEWIQNFLGHEHYSTTMDMYGTISIDEMEGDVTRLIDVTWGTL